jgi:transcription antitermination factor NusG
MGDATQQVPWFAVQVRSCKEKAAATCLQNDGYECFLPLGKSRRQWSDRIKELELPLFPGYLFCRFDPHNRLPILKTPWVLQIVGIGKTPLPVDDGEMAAIQSIERVGLCAQRWTLPIVGQSARIEYGPLRGLSGTVVRVKSQCKLILSITLLQRSVAVEIDPSWVSAPQPMLPSGVSTSSSTPAIPRHFRSPLGHCGTPEMAPSNRGTDSALPTEGGVRGSQELGVA